MELKGCIKTKEIQKGVLSITDIQREHELYNFFYLFNYIKITPKTRDYKFELTFTCKSTVNRWYFYNEIIWVY